MLDVEQNINQSASKYNVSAKSTLSCKKDFLDNVLLASDLGGAIRVDKNEIEDLKEYSDNFAKVLDVETIKVYFTEGRLENRKWLPP